MNTDNNTVIINYGELNVHMNKNGRDPFRYIALFAVVTVLLVVLFKHPGLFAICVHTIGKLVGC